MKTFKEWQEDQAAKQMSGWKASKDEVISHWNSLSPSVPMGELRSVPPNHKGPTYSFDGLRITGSPFWIDYVLSRLKDVIRYEDADGKTRLQVIYKQIVDNKTQQPVPQSYVFYLQVKDRQDRSKEPHLEKPKKFPKIT